MKRNTWLQLLAIAFFVGGIISLAASPSPDGLERVAENQGFLDRSITYFTGVIPDYAVPGIAHEYVAIGLAGVIGTGITFGILWLISALLTRQPTIKK